MASKTQWFKNAIRLYAAELICSTGLSGFQTFNLCFAYMLRGHVHKNRTKGGHSSKMDFAQILSRCSLLCL